MIRQDKLIPAPDIARLIHLIRDQRVILDTDLAALYSVQTFRLNEAVKRNRDRFPEDFMLQLTKSEWAGLRSQFAISNSSQTSASVPQPQALRSQFAILKRGRGQHRKYLPYAFTEHGALMAANILNSPHAVAMSVYVIRAFVRMREDLAANAAILKRLAEIDKTLLLQDVALRDIYQKLRPLLDPPPLPPKPEIGFHVKEDTVPYRVKRRTTRLARMRP